MTYKVSVMLAVVVLLVGCDVGTPLASSPIPTAMPLAVPTQTPIRLEPVKTAPSVLAPITMKITSKDLHQADYSVTGDKTVINFDLEVTNYTGKNIRAYTGVLHFKDLFDRDIKKAGLTVEDGLSAGQTTNIARSLEYNQYMQEDVRLDEIQLKDLSVEFETEQIIYDDGTKQKFP